MAKWKPLVITEEGYQLNALTIAGKTVRFTRAVTSTTDLSAKTKDELSKLTTIEDVVQDLPVDRQTVQDDHTVVVPITILNSANHENVMEDYQLYTIGLYAKPLDTSDGSEKLFGIVTASIPDLIPAFDGTAINDVKVKIKVRVGKAENVDITFSDEDVVRKDDLADYVKREELDGLDQYADHEEVKDAKQGAVDQIQPMIDAEMVKRGIPENFSEVDYLSNTRIGVAYVEQRDNSTVAFRTYKFKASADNPDVMNVFDIEEQLYLSGYTILGFSHDGLVKPHQTITCEVTKKGVAKPQELLDVVVKDKDGNPQKYCLWDGYLDNINDFGKFNFYKEPVPTSEIIKPVTKDKDDFENLRKTIFEIDEAVYVEYPDLTDSDQLQKGSD